MPVSSTTIAPASSATRIIFVLGVLSAFAPLATDMYLPAFSQMSTYFGVSEGGIEPTLSAFFLGLALGQAFYGPLIDRFGRKIPLLCGISIFVAASILCLMTTDIVAFTGLRFVQAVGGCAGMIVGRAIIADMLDPKESARALSLLMITTTLGPIVAPVLGGFIITHFGWQAVFLFMIAFGAVCIVLVTSLVPETLAEKDRSRQSLSQIASVWKATLSRPDFIVAALMGGIAQSALFAFITGSPFVFMTLYEVGAQAYGILFALVAFALIVLSLVNRLLLRRFSAERIVGFGLLLQAATGIATVLVVPTGSLVALLVTLWIAIGALGFVAGNSAAIAMEASGEHRGTGSSLVGVLQFGIAFVVSSLVAILQNGTAYPMTGTIAGCSLLAAALWFAARRSRPAESQAQPG